ncbi:hypothetical protein PALI_a1672 [Pseudoalteromonas aliena SW19]|uniref:Uncharacterized protein n=1 Tax=Pseudoalteromonas aliena SW19 TaxID=1314866 RepID=A0ABR9DVL0_9GAMM|nr:hypothetical protein [Pseudoalteromonas aliena SW19]
MTIFKFRGKLNLSAGRNFNQSTPSPFALSFVNLIFTPTESLLFKQLAY